MSTLVMAEGMLRHYLPDANWRPAVENLGYTLGFLIVIVGRLQLFTENTITAVLPTLANPRLTVFRDTGRLWSIVFVANLVGGFLAALLIVHVGITPAVYFDAMIGISVHLAEKTPLEAMLHGIPAEFLIAALVWMSPNLESGRALIIMVITYVIAGSVEVFLLLLTGDLGLFAGLGGLIVPMLVGNILGGAGLFAMLAYAQVRQEIS